jgi:replicative DNA helicase
MAKIDSWTGGMKSGEAWVIGGRTSQGKSALAIEIALHLTDLGFKVAYFSPEMTREQLGLRFLAVEGKIDLLKLRTGGLHPEELADLVSTVGKLAERGILIDDTAVTSALDVKAKARKLKITTGLDLIIIDHLQELVEKEKFRSRHEAISTEFGRLRALARELDVPIIVVSQLKRTAKDDKKPTLEDLKESGDIENKADVILFVHREEVYNPKPENKGVAEIRIAKQRMGPRKWAEFQFEESFTRFSEIGQKPLSSPTDYVGTIRAQCDAKNRYKRKRAGTEDQQSS